MYGLQCGKSLTAREQALRVVPAAVLVFGGICPSNLKAALAELGPTEPSYYKKQSRVHLK